MGIAADIAAALTTGTNLPTPTQFSGAGTDRFLLRPEDGRFLVPRDFGPRDFGGGAARDFFDQLPVPEGEGGGGITPGQALGVALGAALGFEPARNFIADQIDALLPGTQPGETPPESDQTPVDQAPDTPAPDTSAPDVGTPDAGVPPVPGTGTPPDAIGQTPPHDVTIDEVPPGETGSPQDSPTPPQDEGPGPLVTGDNIVGFLANPVSAGLTALTNRVLHPLADTVTQIINPETGSVFSSGGPAVASEAAGASSGAAEGATGTGAQGGTEAAQAAPQGLSEPSGLRDALDAVGGPTGLAVNAGLSALTGFLTPGSRATRIATGAGNFAANLASAAFGLGPIGIVAAPIAGAIGANARDRDDRIAVGFDPNDRALFDSEGTLLSLVPEDVTQLQPLEGFDGQFIVPGASLDGHPLVVDQSGTLRSVGNDGQLTAPIADLNSVDHPIALSLNGQNVTNTRGGGIGRFDPEAGALVTAQGPSPVTDVGIGDTSLTAPPPASSHLLPVTSPGVTPVDQPPQTIEEQIQETINTLGTAVPRGREASAGLRPPSLNNASQMDIQALPTSAPTGEPTVDAPIPTINSPFENTIFNDPLLGSIF